MRPQRARLGQSMVEYLVIFAALIAVILGFQGAIQGKMHALMQSVHRQLTTSGGRADALLR